MFENVGKFTQTVPVNIYLYGSMTVQCRMCKTYLHVLKMILFQLYKSLLKVIFL